MMRTGGSSREFLAKQRKMKKVFYPGLARHPQHELAKRQMTGFGSMITFETGSLDSAKKLLKRVKACHSGRVARWSGDTDLASGDDDSCRTGRKGTRKRSGSPMDWSAFQ